MGGNALKSTFTRRYGKDEYQSLVGEISGILEVLFPESRTEVIKSYNVKETFGDMDILIESDNLPDNWTKVVIDRLHPNETIKNGDVFSFDYKELQIDLIKSKSEVFDFSAVYFSYNDLGNLMGRIAHKMGLKFGHRGLLYVLREGDKVIKEITLSTSAKEVLTFLGYEFYRHQQGFETLEDVFDFVTSTQYFNPNIFLLENRSHTARTRDAKRKTYNEFLSWLASDEFLDKCIVPYQFNPDKDSYKHMIMAHFPNSVSIVEQALADHQQLLDFRKKFNGNIVKEVTGLEGKALGEFIQLITTQNGGEPSFRSKILFLSDDDIRDLILSQFRL